MGDSKTHIQKYFSNKVIFVTGGTGLLGNILIEKLLRSCPDIKKIYVLVRAKNGMDIQKRFEELINSPIYDMVKARNPDLIRKLIPLAGDLESLELGLSDDDLETIRNEVNCIFHAGATVRFTEKIRRAVMTNISGTNEVIGIARTVRNLKSLVHVSTMFSYCPREVIDEEIYEIPERGEDLIQFVNFFDNDKLHRLTPIIIGEWPNTYTYTKAASEDLLRRTATDLPLAIVRPSIIVSSYKEPLPGWTTQAHSISMFCISFNLGIAHVMTVQANNVVDAVPVDYVVNNLIAAAWSVGTSWKHNETIKIYNCISSQQNPITWGEYNRFARKHDVTMPSNKKVWHRFAILSVNKTLRSLVFWLKLPIVYFSDMFNLVTGAPRTAVKMYKNTHHFLWAVDFFSKGHWKFHDKNNHELLNTLEGDDKVLFNFDFTTIDWNEMFLNSASGYRKFIFKEPIETLPQARRKRIQLKILHYSTILIYLLILFYLFLIVIRLFGGIL